LTPPNTTEESFARWFEENKGLFAPSYSPSYGTESQEVLYNNVLPVLIRDGLPRSRETIVSFVKAYGVEGTDGLSLLVLTYRATANYRVADEEAIAFTLGYGEFEGTREELIEQRPYLTNGEPNNIRLDTVWSIGFLKDGKISGTAYTRDTLNIALDFE
jgi:hypothetical protein